MISGETKKAIFVALLNVLKWLETEVTQGKFGRRSLARYCALTALATVFVPIILGFLLNDFSLLDVKRWDYLGKQFIDEVSDEVGFYAVQVVVVSVSIFALGGEAGVLIIKRRYSPFMIGFLCFFLLWLLVFFSSATTSGIINSTTYGANGFGSAFMSWIVYGVIPFLLWGIANGLMLGYFLGREIRIKGRGRSNPVNGFRSE